LASALFVIAWSAPWAAPTAADRVVESWSARDGLPEDECSALLQTRDGYVWIATNSGLARFDGVRMRVFEPERTPGLRSGRIFNLLEARDGTLWFTTEDAGVGCVRAGRFVAFTPDSFLGGAQARRMLETPDGSIWFSTSRGLARWRAGTLARVAPRELTEPTLVLADDRAGGVWVSTRSGVAHVTDAGVRQWRLAAGPDDQGWWSPYVDRRGRVWLGTAHGLERLEGDAFVPVLAPGLPADERWRVLYDDPASDLPMLRSAGAYARFRAGAWQVFRPGPLTLYKNDPVFEGRHLWAAVGSNVYRDDELQFAGRSQITGLLLDREGALWVATANDGVFRLGPSAVAIAGGRRDAVNRIVSALGEDSGTLWLAAFGEGLVAVRDGREWPTPAADLPRNINDLMADSPGRWLAASNRGIERVALAPGVRASATPVAMATGAATALARGRDGTVWASTEAGILRVRGGVPSVLPESLTHTRAPASALAEDGMSRMWIGTQGAGLLVVQGERVRSIGEREGLPSLRVECLAPDGAHAMWVGLTGHGLAHVEIPESGEPRVRVLGPANELPSATIASLLVENDRLWMGTPDGAAVTSLAALRKRLAGGREPLAVVRYDERDGMLSRRCARGGHAIQLGSDGRVWFATRNGAAGIDPASAAPSPALPPPLVEEVLSGGHEVHASDGSVRLASDQRDLTIRYTSPGFRAPARLRFKYRLHGADRDWVEAGSRREAIYTRLPAGTLRFEVMVADGSGPWSAAATRALVLRPAFHETWGFRLAALLALVALGALADRWRVRRYRRRQDEMALLVATRTRELQAALAQVAAQTATLEDLDRAKSRFFANISHEFRTPLTLTLGPLEDVLSGAVGEVPEDIRTELDVALRNSRRLLRLVNEILDLAKLESGRLVLAVREEDLRGALAEWAQAFQPLAERRRVAFTVELGDAPLPLWFDRERLGKAVTNLLSNAFKFTPEGGSVTLRAAREAGDDGERVRVEVIDTGPGISAAELDRIFERFYQVDESRRRLTPGTGIGLALAKEITELHGGRIAVQSQPEHGATFTLWLPPGREHLTDTQLDAGAAALPMPALEALPLEDGAAPTPAPPPTEEAADVTTVLVVDDNAELRALVRRGLVARYRVVEAQDGLEALALARAATPDLVVSDVMMPGMDGFQLVEAFRADAELDHVPIVLLTARAESEDRIAGLERGADDYIEKPFSAHELGARVDNLIASRRRLRERYGRGFRVVSAAAPSDAADRTYLERLREVIGARLGDEDFGVAELARAMRQDRTQLFRRVRDLLGVPPADLLRASRLERAAELLADDVGGVGEIAYATGFKSVSHFSHAFRQRFGATPTAWVKQRRSDGATAPLGGVTP